MSERGTPDEKKVFSYDEARRMVPQLRRLTEEAVRRVDALRTRDPRKVEAVVDAWVRQVTEMGLEVKGLWLVDFDNGSGYYCWRYPEEGLDYFHSYDDGFRGRMRIQ